MGRKSAFAPPRLASPSQRGVQVAPEVLEVLDARREAQQVGRAGGIGALDRGAVLDQRLRRRRARSRASRAARAPRSRSRPPRRRERGSTACRRSRPASASTRSRGRDGPAGPDRARRGRWDAPRGGGRARSAFVAAARTRRSSVRSPRISRNASNGCRMSPCALRMSRARSNSASARAKHSAPAITSEWPLRYFVAECITTSAPSASGRVKIGVAQVESTARARARGVGDPRRRRDVADPPHRVARRLEPDELRRVRAARRARARRVLRVDEIDGEPESRRVVGEPVAQRPVHHASARRHARPAPRLRNSAIGRRHAGAEHERRGRALERADHGFGLAHGRVVGAAVDVAAAIGVVGVAHEGRRDVDRRHDRARSPRRSRRAPGRRACAGSTWRRSQRRRPAAASARRARARRPRAISRSLSRGARSTILQAEVADEAQRREVVGEQPVHQVHAHAARRRRRTAAPADSRRAARPRPDRGRAASRRRSSRRAPPRPAGRG